jgi:putative endopeptidase
MPNDNPSEMMELRIGGGTRKRPPLRPKVPLPTATIAHMKSSHIRVPPYTKEKIGDNFYHACNGVWLQNTSLPAYRNTYGVSEELEDYIEGFLFQIARTATREPSKRASDAIQRLVLSAMRPEKQEKNVETLKHKLRGFDCMKTADDVATRMAELVRSGVPTILGVTVDVAYVNTRLQYILQFGPGSLGLSDPRYYLAGRDPSNTALHSAAVLREYKRLAHFISKEFDLQSDLATAIDTELEIAKPLLKAQDETELYTAPLHEIQKRLPHIPWSALLEGLQLGGSDGQMSILSLEWLSILNSLFHSLPIPSWVALLSLHTAVHGLQFLPAPYDQLHFNLYGRMMTGQMEKIPQKNLMMNVLRSSMRRYMSYFFIKTILKPRDKKNAAEFVDTLFQAAIQRLHAADWLEKPSREKLVKKLRAMKKCIFYPEPVTLPREIPELHAEQFLENVYTLGADNWSETIARLKKGAPTIGSTWDEPVYSANAYYYPDSNQIILPAGYFFWPFYHADHLGWSYGGVGVIIGHEIIHAFDKEGKEVDEVGRHRTLWSKQDEKKFERRLSKIIELYNQAKVGTVHVDGKTTASENLADLGGAAIALDALEDALCSRGISGARRIAELRNFFWSYAVSWRTKTREKRALQDIFMDKHAPPEVRVNFVVAQMDAWYEAFGVVTGDALYVPPEKRLRIF